MNAPHKGQWRGALMFSLICVWINDWANNREAGDLRRYRGHYDDNVMSPGIGVIKTIQFCNSFQLTTVFTRGLFWPSGIVACVCLHLYVCVCLSITSLSVWQQVCLCKTPWLRSLLFWGFIDLDLHSSQIELKSQNLPHLSLWVCPYDKSMPIEIRFSKFWPKMHLSTVKVPINFRIDCPWSKVSFLI